jgi:hypothetical protein
LHLLLDELAADVDHGLEGEAVRAQD